MENLKSEKGQLVRLERLRAEKKYNEFFVAAEEAALAFPDSYPVKFLYASVLTETKQLEEAENVMQDLLIAYPDNLNLLMELGNVTLNLKKYDEAAEFFNKILFLDPFNDQAKAQLVKIEKAKQGAPAEEEVKPPDFMTYKREKEKARIDEFVMPEAPLDEEAPQQRSEVDTTPFTAATQPEDEFDTVEKKPDFDTKKVMFDIPSSVGSPEQPAAASPAAASAPPPTEIDPDMEFDIPSLDEPALPEPGPPPMPTEPQISPETVDKEFDIPSLDETEQPTGSPEQPTGSPEQSPAVPPPLPVDEQPAKAEWDMEFDVPSLDEPVQPPPIPDDAAVQKADIDTKKVEFIQEPGLDTKKEAAVKQPETGEEPVQPNKATAPEDFEFEIPSVGETGRDEVEIEYEIPDQKTGQRDTEAIADTIVEMEAPKVPGLEQGPPIPPPGLGDDMPPPREIEEVSEHEVPAQPPEVDEVEADEFEIPSALEDSQDDIRVEYEIPAQEPLTPTAEVHAGVHAGVPDVAPSGVDEFEIPSPQPESAEEVRMEYEIPAQPSAVNVSDASYDVEEEFKLPSSPEDSQDDIRVEYEIPSPEPVEAPPGVDELEVPPGLADGEDDIEVEATGVAPAGAPDEVPAEAPSGVDEFEIPSPQPESAEEVRMEYEIPSPEPVEAPPGVDELEVPNSPEIEAAEEIDIVPHGDIDRDEKEMIPAPQPPDPEAGGTQPDTGGPEKIEEVGGSQLEEGEFMTESAAELYLSQGLLDDALTIYEKLYRTRKEERYLMKIRQLSEKRITQKKVQALTRLLNLIEKKGENRV